ncbi:ABC transporter ATP-binding protein [Fusobacterium gonidiaformans]|uniref:ABC transporter ATP-binding protein n=1 Tax=Fusobacterium gonidiaformans TaxID=849 RepID=UPI0023F3FD38|nr:ABC transporter ATP-binding protein [Fusobacterium gonidiaformans]
MIKEKHFLGLTTQGKKDLIRASFSSFFMHFAYMAPIMLIFFFSESVLQGKEASPMIYGLGILVLCFVMYLLIFYNYNTLYNATFQESANLRIHLADTLKNLPLSYYSKHNTSDLSQTIMKDVADIEHAMSHAIPQTFGFILYIIVISILMLLENVVLTLCILVPIFLSFFLLILSKKMQISSSTKYYKQLRENSEFFQESIEMQQEIKSYGQKEKVQQALMKQIEESETLHKKEELSQAFPVVFAQSILKFILGLTVFIGAKLYVEGEVSLLYLLGYLIAASKIMDGMNGLYLNLAEMMSLDARIQRIQEIQQVKRQEGKEIELSSYDIIFQKVSFSYRADCKVIDKVSFVAKQNEVTAIVGASGCGKTTLLRLISRLYDYDEGKIFVGGKEIVDIDINHFFKNISIVFQEVLLFNTSIMENIRIGKKSATDEEVIQAAKLANCDEFVSRFPKGYQTIIGENGSKLSGGERQRISIARAILKDAPIVLLDEISASLDIENERKIQESLKRLLKHKTVIVISHRMKSIEKADNIIVMNEGKIEKIGKHKELLKSSSIYKNMIKKSEFAENYIY